MSAKEQLLLARKMGHELSVEHRTRADFPDADDKWWVACTCGYRSTSRRTKSQVNGVLAWHLGKAISEQLDHVNGA